MAGEGDHPGNTSRHERWGAFRHERCERVPPKKMQDADGTLRHAAPHLPLHIKQKTCACLRSELATAGLISARQRGKQTDRDKAASSLQNTCKVGAKMSHAYVMRVQASPTTGPLSPSLASPLPQDPLKRWHLLRSVTSPGRVCRRTRKLSEGRGLGSLPCASPGGGQVMAGRPIFAPVRALSLAVSDWNRLRAALPRI